MEANTKSIIDRIWTNFWEGGVTNPLTVIEQITYLLFVKGLDDIEISHEKNDVLLGIQSKRIFDNEHQNCRWSKFKDYPAEKMFKIMSEEVFPFIKNLAKDKESGYAKYMEDAIFIIPTPIMLQKVVTAMDKLEMKDRDTKGDVYEYLLSKLSQAGVNGQFRTPRHIIRMMVELMKPSPEDIIVDPACGSGGMFVQSTKFIQRHQGKVQDLAIYGQEKNPTTWKLAKMNLAIRSLNGDLGKFADDTFQNDLHKGLKADFVLANPPFNISDWGQEKLLQDPRWRYGIPPKGNANMAWVEHMIDKLSMKGKAAIILANGALSSDTSGEGDIRKNILEADLVDCILAMPSNLFYTVAIPCSVWILNRDKKQKGKTLFIDARNFGTMVTRKLRELSEEDIEKIASTYHKFVNDDSYEDIAGFCKVATIDEIKENNYVLTPGRYVGVEEQEDDGIPFEEKMKTITSELKEQFEESHKLEEEIKKNLEAIGYGI